MKKIIFLALLLPLFSGCFVSGKAVTKALPESDCLTPKGPLPEVTGYTATAIGYGDSYLVVVPISNLRSNTEFRFVLAPEKDRSDKDAEFKGAWVTISGENATTNTPAPWLSASGQMSSTIEMLVACVPALTVGDTYKYKVTISDKELTETDVTIFGYLDPRAVVIPE